VPGLDDTADVILDRISAASAGALVAGLAEELGVLGALVARKADGEAVRTIAVWIGGKVWKNFNYLLDGAPCERVFADGEYCCLRGVQAEFPRDVDLVRLKIEGYFGVVVRDDEGRVLGHLAVLDDRPIAAERMAVWRAVLVGCAARAGGVLTGSG
jgi:hypothetical protein